MSGSSSTPRAVPGEHSPGGDVASGAAPPDVLRRHRGLVGRTVLVALATVVSRVAGFLREVLSAALFGDRSPMFDAFVTAWRVPNLFRRFLGEGALSTALQTALIEVDDRRGEDAGRRLFLGTLRVLTWILVGLCAAVMLGVWLLPDAMPVTGVPWLGEHPQVVRELTVQLMPFVVLVCLAAACSGALNVRGHFLLPAAAPVVMNAVWIAALLAIALQFGWKSLADPAAESARQLGMVRWLSASMLVGGLLLLLVQVPALWTKGLLPGSGRAAPGADAGSVWTVLRRTMPLAFGAALYQVNVMIDGFMAVGLLDAGGPTAHHMATRLQQLPMSLAAIAATSAVFPALSVLGHRRELGQLRALHDRTQLAVAFVALPAAVGLVVLAEPIVAVCLGHGEFGASGIARTAAALRFLALAIVPAGAVGLLARCYYALGDFRTPVRVSAAMVGANVVLNVLFIIGLGMDVDGLALSTALTSWGNLVLLAPGLGRKLGLPRGEAGRASRVGRMLLASGASGAVGFALERALEGPGGETSAGALALAMGGALAAYLLLAHLLRIPEWHQVFGRLTGRAAGEGEHPTPGKT